MVNLKIDGKSVQIEKGATILAAAEKAGIRIPTLCFLKKVSPTGACRICVVDVEGVDKPMASCHTVATEGMAVTTQSPRLELIRKQVVELLLVNHPLDCPVCDAGGECDLQDACYEFDVSKQPFEAEDVNPETIDRWPLIQQVPSRCILCEKCVKVCHEVVGSSSLFVNDKGDRAFIDKHLDLCEFCGSCVQVCPTGTMISKPFKFRARPWELKKTPSVCGTCGSQCEIDLNVKQNALYRVTSEDGKTVNDGTLCIGGFFGYDFVNAPERLTAPLLRKDDALQPADWGEALQAVVKKARNVGGGACAGLTSGRLTNEEIYLFQKLFRLGFGSNNIDSEARFGYLRAIKALNQALGLKGASNHLDRIGRAKAVLVFGADPTAEAPAVDWQIEKACRKFDGKLVLANMRQVKLSRYANVPLQYRPGSEIQLANALARLILDQGLADMDFIRQHLANADELEAFLRKVDLDAAVAATGFSLDLLSEAAQQLGEASSVALIFGRDVTYGAGAEDTVQALCTLALVCGALHGDAGGLFPLDEKSNVQGLVDMGLAPELLPGQTPYAGNLATFENAWGKSLPAEGKNAEEILRGIEAGEIHFLYLAGVNPLRTFPESSRWRQALQKVDCLVVQDILASELTELAQVVLPGTSFAEKDGSLTGFDGRIGYLAPGMRPLGSARPDRDIFAALLSLLVSGEALSLAELQAEIKNLSGIYEDICFTTGGRKVCYKQAWIPERKGIHFRPVEGKASAEKLQLLSGKVPFHFGTTTTFSKNAAQVAPSGYVEMNPSDAEALGIKDGAQIKLSSGGESAQGPVRISSNVPQGLLFAPYHFAELNVQRLMKPGANLVQVEVAKA